MRIASIDIGSNTVLLLICELKNAEIFSIQNEYRMPRIGEGVKYGSQIGNEKIIKLLRILDEYKAIADSRNCEKILAVGTAALRKASNGLEIVERINTDLGIEVEIIDGKTEAYLSFLGATGGETDNNQNRLVIDIGGSSTEIIYGNGEKIFFSNSFPEGAVTLKEKFIKTDPYSQEDVLKLKEFLINFFDEVKKSIPKNPLTFAVAGTPTTLASIKNGNKNYDEKKVANTILKYSDLLDLETEMLIKSSKHILSDYGEVVLGREDVINTGLIILSQISKILNISEIKVSTKGIRYGLVYKLIANGAKGSKY